MNGDKLKISKKNIVDPRSPWFWLFIEEEDEKKQLEEVLKARKKKDKKIHAAREEYTLYHSSKIFEKVN